MRTDISGLMYCLQIGFLLTTNSMGSPLNMNITAVEQQQLSENKTSPSPPTENNLNVPESEGRTIRTEGTMKQAAYGGHDENSKLKDKIEIQVLDKDQKVTSSDSATIATIINTREYKKSETNVNETQSFEHENVSKDEKKAMEKNTRQEENTKNKDATSVVDMITDRTATANTITPTPLESTELETTIGGTTKYDQDDSTTDPSTTTQESTSRRSWYIHHHGGHGIVSTGVNSYRRPGHGSHSNKKPSCPEGFKWFENKCREIYQRQDSDIDK